MPAPFVPKIKHELDVSNFADEFTLMQATDSPAVVPVNGEKLFKVMEDCGYISMDESNTIIF